MSKPFTSFPYLRVAQEHDVPYGEVIRYAEALDVGQPMDPSWYIEGAWEREACEAWWAEKERRGLVR